MAKPTKPVVQAVEVVSLTEGEAGLGLDPATLDKNLRYRFVQVRPQRIARLKARGYEFVSAAESGVRTLVDGSGGADDKIYNGDTVLMAVPKARHMQRRKQIQDMTRGRLAAPKQQFRKKAKDSSRGLSEEIKIHERSKED